MSFSSSLTEIADPLALDTSVLINLQACTYGERILATIPNQIIVADIVAGELENELSRQYGAHAFLQNLVRNRIVEVVAMTDAEYEIFQKLTSVSPTLDDGEAATIAVAAAQQFLPVIDERKGRARASAFTKDREPGWSLDLIRHPAAVAALGDEVAIQALYLALVEGRMRIPSQSVDGIIELLGIDRSKKCTCLPGYRERFGNGT